MSMVDTDLICQPECFLTTGELSQLVQIQACSNSRVVIILNELIPNFESELRMPFIRQFRAQVAQ